MGVRVSEEHADVVIAPTSQNARVTDLHVDVVVAAVDAEVRVSDLWADVVIGPEAGVALAHRSFVTIADAEPI